MSEAPPVFKTPSSIDSPEVTGTLQSHQNTIQDGVLFRSFSCISTVDPQVKICHKLYSRTPPHRSHGD